MNLISRSIITLLLLAYGTHANADYKDDIGYTRLATELGSAMPDADIVIITQAEAATSFVDHDNNSSTDDRPVYLADPNNSALSNDTIVDMSNLESGNFSGHATGVGRILYGNNSIASGSNTIQAYWASKWLASDFLNYGSMKPLSSPSRVANHSWIANFSDLAIASNLLRRIDWVITRDEFVQIVGVKNNTGTNANTFSAAYNVLAVGKTDGNHSTGSPTVDSSYPPGRMRTEIVAPFTTTSSATPAVSATAALLIDTGHSDPGLSTDTVEKSTKNRNKDTIYNAERSEVIKAALLAGADRLTQNTSTTANISDYRGAVSNQTDNGMDARFGAGQVNTYNSYHIIAGGEQNSSQDGGPGSAAINTSGFDYDPSFGGSNSSNTEASYLFSTGTYPEIFSASLVWHIDIDAGKGQIFSGAATFYDLDLYLYDVTGSQTLLVDSTSLINNSENIWTSLSANRNYLLKVIPKTGQSSFDWDYALAWQLLTDTDGDGIENNIDDDDDNDGLTDTAELTIGTNPLVTDTDNDGFSDFDEVSAGSDPIDASSMPVTADGDLNSDGTVDVRDILLGQQILTGLIALTADHLNHGDVAPLVNGTPSPNGIFNTGDFLVIQQKVMGVINF